MAWIWSPTDVNLSYLCLGATSLLVPETFKFKSFETWLPATTIMGVQSNFSLSCCLYWYANLSSCKYLKSQTHLRNAQINKASSVNKQIVKICLVMDMLRKNWSWIVVASCGLYYFVSLVLIHFESLRILVQPKDLNIRFSQLWKFIP